MARLTVYSASGVKKYEGAPSFVDSYLKVGYIEFREVSSAAPIQWEVGDYVDYPRTGLRYKLYSVPIQTVRKQARKDSYGAAFVYQNVQFFDPTKMLELAPFRDLVRGDSRIHFSTQNSIAVWDDVYGIAERIEVSLNEMFPGEWSVQVVSTEDQDLLETLRTELNYSVEGVSCLGALDKIYELWNNTGWTYSFVGGKHTITIGGADVRTAANTAPEFSYGRGRGLVTLERAISNRDDMATRLYVYGSSKNMVSRYYNNLPASIKDKDSIDIQHLMLPVEPIAALDWPGWGMTDGQYDASKSYIQNDEAIAKYGLIVKSVYLDGAEYEDIFPTLKGITIGELRNLIGNPSAKYYPRESSYSNPAERVDQVQGSVNPIDPGVISTDGSKFYIRTDKQVEEYSEIIEVDRWLRQYEHEIVTIDDFDGDEGTLTIASNQAGYLFCKNRVLDGAELALIVRSAYGKVSSYAVPLSYRAGVGGHYYDFTIPEVTMPDDFSPDHIVVSITGFFSGAIQVAPVTFFLGQGTFTAGLRGSRSQTFKLTLKQIGFDINERAALGEGKATLTMKSGMCNGRSFLVKSCKYNEVADTWDLLMWRQKDTSIDMWYPNADYTINPGETFVLTDIAMPDVYIRAAAQKLLITGRRLLAELSAPVPVFTPKVDAKVIREYQVRKGSELSPLRSGMYLHISDEDIQAFGNDYVLIDTVTINEGEANIPTYTITLREKKKVTIKESVAAGGADMTTSVMDGSSASQQVASGGTSLDEVWQTLQENRDPYKDSEIHPNHIPGYASIKEKVEKLDSLFDVDDNGDVYTRDYQKDGQTKHRGIYTPSFVSAGGKSTTGGGGGGESNVSIREFVINAGVSKYSTENVSDGVMPSRMMTITIFDNVDRVVLADTQVLATAGGYYISLDFGSPLPVGLRMVVMCQN